MVERIKNTFSLDVRSLALMRICISLVLIADIFIRWTDLSVFYSDEGIMPRDLLFNMLWPYGKFSLHVLSGSVIWECFLFFVALVVAFFLLFGYKTRLSTIVSWILLLSIQNRNPMILQSGDDLLRMILFWGIFLPWNKAYSIDKFRDPDLVYGTKSNYFGAASAAYILQIVLVYIVTALLKDSEEWRTDYTASYYALSLDQMILPLGKLIYPYPTLLKVLTYIVWHIEMYVPLLLFIPAGQKYFRLIVFILLAGINIGFGSMLFVGLFFLISLASLIGLLPGETIDFLEKKMFRIKRMFKSKEQKKEEGDFSVLKIIFTRDEFFIAKEAILVFFIWYSLLWNMGTVPAIGYGVSESLHPLGYMLRLDQYWGMFAPRVFKDDGWFIYEAKDSQGNSFDIREGKGPINYGKPANIVALYKNDRWRKYGENILAIDNSYLRPFYCKYLIHQYNLAHPYKPISGLKIIYMKEFTAPDYAHVEPEKVVLCECNEP